MGGDFQDALFEDEGGPAWGITNYVDSFHTELSHFVSAPILGERALSTLRDAADALAIIEATERSIEANGAYEAVEYAAAWETGDLLELLEDRIPEEDSTED